MLKSVKILRTYYKQAGVKPILLVLEFIALLVPAIASIYSAVLAANVISALTVYDYSGAIKQLSINFGLIIISAISYFIYHLLSKKVNRTILINLNKFVYENVRQNQNVSKISLSTINNISTCVDFNKDLLYKLCFFIKAIVTIAVVIYHNLYLGLGLIAISLVMGLLLKFTDKKIQTHQQAYSNFQSSSLELFNSIQKGSKLEDNINLETRLKDKYFAMCNNGAKTKNKIAFYYSINNNVISLILKAAVFGFTIYLITLIKSTTLTLSLYLILTPYLTSSAENLLEFFELFSEIGLIDNIMQEFDSLKFRATLPETTSAKELELNTYNLYFYHTTLECKENETLAIKNSQDKPSLKQSKTKPEKPVQDMQPLKLIDVNLKINFGETVCFVGETGSGKRAIFKLLSREKACTSGSIFLDYKNIAEISPENYKQIVACTSKRAYFYNISILENLMLVCDNRTKINNAIKSFGLKADIDRLPNKINTIVGENFNPKLIYFLGLLRAYISGAKIICIYESPENFNRTDITKLMHILKFLKGKCTVICFSHSDIFNKQSDKIYYIEKGKIINNK